MGKNVMRDCFYNESPSEWCCGFFAAKHYVCHFKNEHNFMIFCMFVYVQVRG